MSFLQKALGLTTALACIGGTYAKLDLKSNSNVVVYWGQDSLGATSNTVTQKRLSHYCEDPNIDVIVMAFLMTINGPGGAPEFDLASATDECTTIEGTGLKKCPQVEEDIASCHEKGKTIIMSIGGATYSEGGFDSEEDAKAGAELLWKTFGPAEQNGPDEPVSALQPTAPATGTLPPTQAPTQAPTHAPTQAPTQAPTKAPSQPQPTNADTPLLDKVTGLVPRAAEKNSTIHRPFGKSSVDGFDLDFEATSSNMGPFANRMRELMDAETNQKYFLTAAPQCPYPDAADKPFLNGPDPASMDAVWIQFYNNPCGVNSFKKGEKKQSTFNFETWDNWAKNGSKNEDVKLMIGVPGGKTGANTGFLPASELKPVIEYGKKFDSFGGIMVWDVTQAYDTKGFLPSIKDALKGTASRVLRYAFRRDAWY